MHEAVFYVPIAKAVYLAYTAKAVFLPTPRPSRQGRDRRARHPKIPPKRQPALPHCILLFTGKLPSHQLALMASAPLCAAKAITLMSPVTQLKGCVAGLLFYNKPLHRKTIESVTDESLTDLLVLVRAKSRQQNLPGDGFANESPFQRAEASGAPRFVPCNNNKKSQ